MGGMLPDLNPGGKEATPSGAERRSSQASRSHSWSPFQSPCNNNTQLSRELSWEWFCNYPFANCHNILLRLVSFPTVLVLQ